MTPREIIAEAWAVTLKYKKIRRWGFFSSFFETLLNVKLIGYQLYFLHAYLTGRTVGFFDDAEWMYNNLPFWLFFTIVATFLLLLCIEWLVPNLALGAIIGLTAKAEKHEEVKGGLVLALYNFFPLFAIHEFLVLSSWSMAVTLTSVVLRYVDGGIKWIMVGIIIFFWVFSNVLKFLFSFAQPAVVIQRTSIFHAMGQSLKLIISYLSQVMFLLLLLFVISIRVMINALIVFIIPLIVIGVGVLLTLFFSLAASIITASILGILLILVASYFFAYLHVFREAVWTITYLQLKQHKDLDVIEG